MRVAAACLDFGGHLTGSGAENDRIAAAVRLADAFVRADMVTEGGRLVVGPEHSEIVDTPDGLAAAAQRQQLSPFLVLPIGQWARLILS